MGKFIKLIIVLQTLSIKKGKGEKYMMMEQVFCRKEFLHSSKKNIKI